MLADLCVSLCHFMFFYCQSIKDWMLFIIVAALTGVDVLLLTIETSASSTRVETRIVPDTQQFEVTALVSDKLLYYYCVCNFLGWYPEELLLFLVLSKQDLSCSEKWLQGAPATSWNIFCLSYKED